VIRPRASLVFAAGVALVAMAAACDAATAETTDIKTTVRSGNHTDFGRVVVDTTGKAAYRVDQDGDHVVVRFGDHILLGNSPSPPRNVIALKTDGRVIELT
jgi:hypothetical protein